MGKLTGYQPLLQEHEKDPATHHHSLSKTRRTFTSFLFASLLLSILVNGFLGLQYLRLQSQRKEIPQSSFTGLARDIPRSWTHHTPYTGTDEDQISADFLWDNISVDAGTVALSRSYAAAKGLPEAQKFPWDNEMGLYLLNGYHNLHCLKKIRTAVREFQLGVAQTAPLYHVYHCLDALRQEVLCDADDIPRYTGMGQASKASATHQIRLCKDWGRMETWALTHSACWHYEDEKHAPANTLEQFRHCPGGSPFASKIEAYFDRDP